MHLQQLTVGTQPQYFASLASHRDKVAVVCEDVRLTWSDLARRVHLLARAWENLGLERGDKIATFIKNRAEYVELVHSMARVGITIVPLSFRYSASELTRAVNASDARVVIVDVELLGVFDAAKGDFDSVMDDAIYVTGDGEHGYRAYGSLFEVGDQQPIIRNPDENDVVWMAFTGGTTGAPKACLVPQRVAVQMWTSIVFEINIGQNDVQLVAGPFHHGVGFQYALGAIYIGATIVIMRDFRPELTLATIEAEKINFIPAAPTLYAMLLGVENKSRYDVSSVRVALSAGSPLLTPTKLNILEYFRNAALFEVYGSTEGGIYTVLKPADQIRKVRCAGQPFWGTEIRIMDELGQECAQSEIGLIYKRGSLLGAEYYNDPEGTEAQFIGDWHTSFDMGYLDEEGFLFVADRKKDMIISGGVNIYPTEIEDTLVGHPAVKEAAVVGLPDETWGELVCAFLSLELGQSVETDELAEFCRQRLARYKTPRRFEFIDDLPKTAAGKINRRSLRDPYWDGRRARV